MKSLDKHIIFFLLTSMLISCTENQVITPDDPPVKSLYEFTSLEKIFGFEGQNRYSYCPSIVKLEDGTIHMFFCGNPESNIMVDNVYHIRINADSSKTKEKSVLQPGISGSWDDHHTCDPSVIAGDYSMNGKSYKYAMFYLSNMYGVYYNEIGVAFSNDLESDSWTKYPHQIVKKTWTTDGDQLFGNGGKSWGVGQPSAISLDKKGQVLLTYTVGDIDGTRIEWSQLDLSNMDSFVPTVSRRMIDEGLKKLDYTLKDYTCNSDFAIDRNNNIIVMVRPVQPCPSDYPAYLNISLEVDYIPFTDFINSTGIWKSLLRITPSITKYPRNHNAGIERNTYGEIACWETPTIYYTVSKAAPDVEPAASKHAEWTYTIWRGKIIKNQ
jgi:hypothetical protein